MLREIGCCRHQLWQQTWQFHFQGHTKPRSCWVLNSALSKCRNISVLIKFQPLQWCAGLTSYQHSSFLAGQTLTSLQLYDKSPVLQYSFYWTNFRQVVSSVEQRLDAPYGPFQWKSENTEEIAFSIKNYHAFLFFFSPMSFLFSIYLWTSSLY